MNYQYEEHLAHSAPCASRWDGFDRGDRDDDRDLAHERDMAQLRREQLAAEDFDGDELLGDPDEWFEHYPLDSDE